MGDTSRLSIAALVAATAALVWAAVLQWRAPQSAACNCAEASNSASGPPTASPLTQTVGPLAVKVTSLERRLANLERRTSDSGLAKSADGSAAPEPEPEAEPFVSLSSPHPALRVEQLDSGAYAAHNTDPSLTGKTFVVEGRRADGTTEKISITVPAPEK